MNEKNISAVPGKVPRILIVDDEPKLCSVLEQFIRSWEFEPESINNPLDVAERIAHRFYNVALLDIRMPNKSGIEVIPDIKERSPETKIIMMTAYAEKETAIKALRLGAFDYLEKPFEKEILHHAVKHALDVQEMELEYRKTHEELKRREGQLLANQSKLKEANKQLMETNNALSVLAQNIDRTRRETEFQICTKIRSSIMPVIEKLKRSRHLAEFRVELDVLMDFIDDLLAGLSTEPQIAHVLSATEFRVAALIKNGLTTDEIADHLYVAACTVKTHRRNIRKKLNLNHSSQNLKTYLRSKFSEE